MLGRIQRDYYAGALMMIIGLAAAYLGHSYGMGSLSQMGPGFFPAAVGILVAVMGVLIALGARQHPPEAGWGRAPEWRGWSCILLGVIAFIVVAQYGGLLPATFAVVFISAKGARGTTIWQAAGLALAMCVICVVVFWWALQLQLPLFAWGG